MNTSDRMAALELSQEKQQREDFLNVGGLRIRKADGGESDGFLFGGLLLTNNGTLIWDIDDPINGLTSFNNIYQYAAAEVMSEAGSIRDRIEMSQMHEQNMRSGAASFAKWMEQQWGIPIFRCKSSGSGNKITAITVDPDFIVDEVTGMTAEASQRDRDTKAIKGQANAAFLRIGRAAARKQGSNAAGEQVAQRVLIEAMSTAAGQKLVMPRRIKSN